ncbi:MAG: hypothetical protein PHW49_08350, partial [Acinetobacter harbinensis]|nr:hypothetical protein [Acinetobacter harbinensis]
KNENVKMIWDVIHQAHFDPFFLRSIAFEMLSSKKKCLIFNQLAGFDVVTDLFFKILNECRKKSCISCKVASN